MKTFLISAGALFAVGLLLAGFLIYPPFGLAWLVIATLGAVAFGLVELRNRHIVGSVQLAESAKIHADIQALRLGQAQIIQLQPASPLGYGTFSNLHTYSPKMEQTAAPPPAPLALPGPEPSHKAISLSEAISTLPKNQLALCFGTDPATGQPEISTLYGTMHTMIGASTGMGKSSLLAGLLAQLLATNKPDLFDLFICDVKKTTARWFEGLANVAYSLEEILQTVVRVDRELQRRMAGVLIEEKPIILVIEEALATRKMFGRLEDRKAALNQFLACLDNISLLGREFGVFLYWASQVDYATSELQDVRGQFAARIAGSLLPTAATSMGFQSKELINQIWKERKPGQFLIESPSGARIILAPRLDLKRGELATILPRPTVIAEVSTSAATAPSTRPGLDNSSKGFTRSNFYDLPGTEQAERAERNGTVIAEAVPASVPPVPLEVEPPMQPKKSVSQIQNELGVSRRQAYKIWQEMGGTGGTEQAE